MRRIETSLPGACLIEPAVSRDKRGFFFESYHEAKYTELGIADRFVQDNHAKSTEIGTLRGLHYQINRPQAKLCRVVQGEVLDVIVDIRYGSPHFGRHVHTVLSAENKVQLYVPPGFAHGYLVLSDTAEFLYKCSEFYVPEWDRGIAWNDPKLGIQWGIESPILSEKDQCHPNLSEVLPADLPSFQ
ncbi:MAG: dTDP-4-dehydrorhamnose 3,5-epimerase [Acidobacteriota bacterium]